MRTLKLIAVSILTMVSCALADTNDSWTPSGNVTALVQSKNLHPTLTFVKYDKPQAMLDGLLNLPAGFAVELSEYAGLNNRNLDGDKGDEFDAIVWKKFTLSPTDYLKLRLKYIDNFPGTDMDGKDMLAYDAFLGRVIKVDPVNTVTPEIRVEYWHYVRDLNESMVSVMPSLAHEYQFLPKVKLYDQFVLQWNDKLAPFGQLLSGQARVGLKVNISHDLVWNLIDVWGIMPLTQVSKGDPRQDGEVAYTTALKYNF